MYSLNTTSLSKLLTKSYNASQDIQIRYVLYTKANSCFIDRFNEEPNVIENWESKGRDLGASSLLDSTCLFCWLWHLFGLVQPRCFQGPLHAVPDPKAVHDLSEIRTVSVFCIWKSVCLSTVQLANLVPQKGWSVHRHPCNRFPVCLSHERAKHRPFHYQNYMIGFNC